MEEKKSREKKEKKEKKDPKENYCSLPVLWVFSLPSCHFLLFFTFLFFAFALPMINVNQSISN